MEKFLQEINLLLSVSMANLNDEQIEKADKLSNELWNEIIRINDREDLSAQELMTMTLITISSLIELIMEVTKE